MAEMASRRPNRAVATAKLLSEFFFFFFFSTEATTISECLHTFCKKCITDKLTEGVVRCCPECNTDLGTHPLNKLRADHDLQDLRAKIFPAKKTKTKAVEATTSSVPLPARQKERSLSSLGVNPPTREATQSSATETRTKSARKRVIIHPEPINVKAVRDPPGNTNTAQTIQQIAIKVVQEAKNAADLSARGKGRAETSRSTSQGSVFKSPRMGVEHDVKLNNHDDGNALTFMPSTSVRRRKLGRPRKVVATCEVINIPDDPVVDVPSSHSERGANPMWFCLVVSTNQIGIALFPQIPSQYLRIKDGSAPVSHIKKYLVNKLNLINELEVDISLQGQSLPDTWQLQEVRDLWLQTALSSQVIQTTVGSPAKDVVMKALTMDDIRRCDPFTLWSDVPFTIMDDSRQFYMLYTIQEQMAMLEAKEGTYDDTWGFMQF